MVNTTKTIKFGGHLILTKSDISSDLAVQAEIMSWLLIRVTSLGLNVWQFLNWEHRPEI